MQDVSQVAATRALELKDANDLRSAQQARGSTPEAAGKKFEELLATLLVKEMRRELPEGFFGQGAGSDIFEGWLDEHLGAELARGGKLGIGKIVAQDLAHIDATAKPAGEGRP